MNVAASMAVALAERVEKSGGPKAGLVAWRTLATNATSGDVRARATLSALRCAVALRDLGAIRELSIAWEIADATAPWEPSIAAVCKEMARSGLLVLATELALAETRRRMSARGLYLYARCLDVAGDSRAADAFAAAAARADEEGAADVALASRVRRIAWLARSIDDVGAALAEAARLDLSRVAPFDRPVVARVLLRSTNRFQRAGAIAALDGLVASGDGRLARRALTICARHVDESADALTPLEIDRLVAVFGRDAAKNAAPGALAALRAAAAIARASDAAIDAAFADACEVDSALAPLLRRARDILAGRFEPHAAAVDAPAPSDPRERVLEVVVALRDGATARAAKGLRAFVDDEEQGRRAPPQALAVLRPSLESEDAEVRGLAARFVETRLKSPDAAAPPRGWLEIAHALSAVGMEGLADRVRRAAAARGEPAADDAVVFALTRSGWQLARAGHRDRAIAALREAKELALRASSRTTPSK